MRRVLVVAFACLYSASFFAQSKLSDDVRQYVSVDAPTIAIAHVRVIDGTGEAPREDQTIVIAKGKIERVGAAASVTVPSGAKVLDKTGYTVIPGLVGMHEHLYYTASVLRKEKGGLVPPGYFINEIPYTAALPGGRSHDGPHHRFGRAVHRFEFEGGYRQGPDAGSETFSYCSVPGSVARR